MTREEAIRLLELLAKFATLEESKECYELAIEALKQPEIIRCQDCKYCEEVDPGLFFCDSVDIVPVGQYVEPDGFCSMARRREE